MSADRRPTFVPIAIAFVALAAFVVVNGVRSDDGFFGIGGLEEFDATAPTITDHWHHAYGFYICGEWVTLDGDAEARDANGRPTNVEYSRTGIHSHDDGLIHWHPFSSASTGRRAQLGVFLDVYGIEITDENRSNPGLQFPEDQRARLPERFADDGRFETGVTKCNESDAEPGRLTVVRWDDINDSGSGTEFVAGFGSIGLNDDALAVAIAFTPPGTEISLPPSVTDFADNVANDGGRQSGDELFPGLDDAPEDEFPDIGEG